VVLVQEVQEVLETGGAWVHQRIGGAWVQHLEVEDQHIRSRSMDLFLLAAKYILPSRIVLALLVCVACF